VLVHFDLKGAPLKIGYILKILSMLKTLGATGIILEYEDTFPYSETLSGIAAKNAYSKKNVIEILQTANSLGLNVIPLVQTFGHLEFALKLKEFQGLREVHDSPQSICPSLNTSFTFIEEMLTQVINLHTLSQQQQRILMNRKNRESGSDNDRNIPEMTHIHIGCDEVYQLGTCTRCRERVHDTLFLDHVYNVAAFVRKKWPKLKVIIWDDQLRGMSVETLRASGIGRTVEPMVWAYTEDIYKFISSVTWDKYSQVFRTAWVAGAFKGAFGETLLIPQGRRHLENTLRWLAIIQGEGTR
jgi:hexosaminidase